MTTSNPARKRWVAIALCLIVACAGAVILKGSWLLWKLPWLTQRFYHHGLRLVTVTSGLATPWSLAFLPDGSMLVTEREGRLRRIEPQGGAGQVVSGLPPVWAEGEGGLLGVVIDPGFASNGLIYWTYAEPAPLPADGGSLAVARGHLVGTALSDVKVIFRDSAPHADPRDFGGRLVFGADGRLFVTIGERAVPEDAQKLSSPRGKVIRIDSDGNAPSDNPFVGTAGANPAIWALGFRDPQGIALDTRSGRLWAGDHGPAGGDELNIIVRGHNYGWPVISYGVDEGTGKQIGEGTQKPGLDQPVVWWGKVAEEGVPPTGMTFLTSSRYPEWQDQLFMGTLWGQAMVRLRLRDTQVVEQQRMFTGAFERIRDVKQGPDGWLYIVANRPDGSIIRLEW